MDQAVLGEATLGVTFTADACGRFGEPSQVGVGGAFRAVECEDIGSPGFAPPLVPLSITQPPVSQTVDGGSEATFRARVCGLPRPRGYQWYHNGTPIAGARTTAFAFPLVVNYAGCGLAWTTNTEPSDLVIPSVQPAHAGQYYVVVTNGVRCVTSAVVTLTVSTNPSPPRIEWPPAELWFPLVAGRPQTNLVVTPWQTANFAVLLRGYPVPTLQWSWSLDGTNFVNLPLATNHTLSVPYAQPSHAGVYRVRAQNSRGVTNAYASLTVKAKPRLKITEAMCEENNRGRSDWWELTNVGGEPVDLYGYRWDDWPGNIGGGATVNRPVLLQPGESVILVESTAPEVFRRWWGADNLPQNLQFIIYGANGLAGDGDEITLWNPTATDDSDFLDSVGFSTATRGASFWFEPDDLCSEFGVVSVAGQCGAWRAAEDGDAGSPGWTARAEPCLVHLEHGGSYVLVWWQAQPGSTNRLQHASRLATPPSATAWTTLGTYCFPGATGAEIDFNLGGAPQRFYRVVRDAPCPCPCEMPFAIFPDGQFFWTADPTCDPNPAD